MWNYHSLGPCPAQRTPRTCWTGPHEKSLKLLTLPLNKPLWRHTTEAGIRHRRRRAKGTQVLRQILTRRVGGRPTHACRKVNKRARLVRLVRLDNIIISSIINNYIISINCCTVPKTRLTCQGNFKKFENLSSFELNLMTDSSGRWCRALKKSKHIYILCRHTYMYIYKKLYWILISMRELYI